MLEILFGLGYYYGKKGAKGKGLTGPRVRWEVCVPNGSPNPARDGVLSGMRSRKRASVKIALKN
jgi:hypothetical protein